MAKIKSDIDTASWDEKVNRIFSGDVVETLTSYDDKTIADLKNYVHPDTNETVMTRLVKQFNQLGDDDSSKLPDWAGNKDVINKNKNQMELLFKLKYEFGYRASKKDGNGDSPKKLLKQNKVWNVHYEDVKEAFSRPNNIMARAGHNYINGWRQDWRKMYKGHFYPAVVIGAGLSGLLSLKAFGDIEKAKKNLIETTADSTHTSADRVLDTYASATQNGLFYGVENLNEFREYAQENGIRVKPYFEADKTALRYDGEGDRTIYLNAAYLQFNDNAEDIIQHAVETIQIDPNAKFQHSILGVK